VAVHRTPEVRNRQVVVARLDEDVPSNVTNRWGRWWLMPENEDFEPLKVDMRGQSLIIEEWWSGFCGLVAHAACCNNGCAYSPVIKPACGMPACTRAMPAKLWRQ
jgi:hypothetical protein